MAVLTALIGWAGYQGIAYWRGRSLRAAQEAADRYAWPEADRHVKAALLSSPNNPAAHLLAARIARRLEHLVEASEHLEECVRLQGSETQAVKVERALLRVYRGDLAGAEPFLRSCVADDDPDTVEILDVLSAALFLNSRAAEAHRCLDDLLRRQPDHFHALVRRGWTAENQSWYAEAADSFQKALDLRPDVDNVRLSLAEIQVVLGRFADARENFESLRQRQPTNPSVLFGLARAQAGLGRKEEAVELLDQVIADDKNDWKALVERGWLLVQLDRPEEGVRDLLRAESLAPPDLPLLKHLADGLRLCGKPDEAKAYREKADRLQEEFQQAGQLGDLIREKSPDDPALRHELACILLRLGKRNDALHWFQTALQKDPKYRPTHESLAAFYEKAGDLPRAAYHRRILQELGSPASGTSP
jgi:tetratricopeptide (TPR) repeat protein